MSESKQPKVNVNETAKNGPKPIIIVFLSSDTLPAVHPPIHAAPQGRLVRWNIVVPKEEIFAVAIEFIDESAKYFENGKSNRAYNDHLDTQEFIIGWVPEDRPNGADKYTVTGFPFAGKPIVLDPIILVTDP